MPDTQPDESTNPSEPQETPQTVKVYSNFAGLSATPEEFVIRFGQRDVGDPSKVTEIVRVFLSFPHAKRLAIALTRSLKSYEEIFGVIEVDPIKTLSAETRAKLGVKE